MARTNWANFMVPGATPGAPTGGGNQSSGATYFPQQGQLPDYIQQILSALSGEAGGAAGQYNDYISNPTASPLYQNALSGLLGALAPSEHLAQTNLQDQFRNAGNMSSGAFGNAGANLQGDLLRNRQTLASQLLSQQFPQMIQALMAPQSQLTSLINGLKLSQQFGAPQVGGGGTRGGISDPFGVLSSGNIDFNHSGIPNPYAGNADPGLALSGVNATNNPGQPNASNPATNPWADLERILNSGGGGGGNIVQTGPYSWTTDNWGNQTQYQPWTGSLLTAPTNQNDVSSGGEY